MLIYCLHGFLGHPKDFLCLDVENKICPNLLSKGLLDSSHKFSDWVDNFYQFVNKSDVCLENQALFSGEKKVLIGYSLGGRLALEFFLKYPNLFEKVILISTNIFSVDKAVKKSFDEKWSRDFLKKPWEELIKDWDKLEVFKGTKKYSRLEKDYKRNYLSQSLTNWSSLNHSAWTKELFFNDKLHFILGSKDEKYSRLYKKYFGDLSDKKLKFIHKAGHRILLDQPQALKKHIDTLII